MKGSIAVDNFRPASNMSLEEEEFGSDTDDDDYVPDGDHVAASEEENSGDDEGFQNEGAPSEGGAGVGGKKKRKRKASDAAKKKKKNGGGGRGFMFEEDNSGVDWKAEEQKEKAEMDEEVEKKKTEDIWAEFKRDTGGISRAKPKPLGGGLSSILATATPAVKENLPAKPKSRFGSLFDDIEKKVDESPKSDQEVVKPKNRFGSLFDAPPKVEHDKGKEEKTEKSGDKVEITKVFDFAGEVVKVSKQVD